MKGRRYSEPLHFKQIRKESMKTQVALVGQTHKGQYPPSMFEPNTLDLAKQAVTFGLDDEAVKSVNIKRYMRNLEVLEKHGMKLAIMPEQTNEMVLTALYQDIKSFKHVANQTPEVCEFALSISAAMIQYFEEQTDEQIVFAIGSSVENIRHIRKPKIEHIKFALSIDWNSTLRSLNNQFIDDEVIKLAIDECAETWNQHENYYTFQNHVSYTPLSTRCNQELVDYALTKSKYFALRCDGQFLTKEVLNELLEIDINFIDLLYPTALNLLSYITLLRLLSTKLPNKITWMKQLKDEYITYEFVKTYVDTTNATYGFVDDNLDIKKFTDEELMAIWPDGVSIRSIYGRDVSEALVKHAFRGAAKSGELKEQFGYCKDGSNFKYQRLGWMILAKLRLL